MSVYHIFFMHSSTNGPLRCFHIFAVVHSAAVKVGVLSWKHLSLLGALFVTKIPVIFHSKVALIKIKISL